MSHAMAECSQPKHHCAYDAAETAMEAGGGCGGVERGTEYEFLLQEHEKKRGDGHCSVQIEMQGAERLVQSHPRARVPRAMGDCVTGEVRRNQRLGAAGCSGGCGVERDGDSCGLAEDGVECVSAL